MAPKPGASSRALAWLETLRAGADPPPRRAGSPQRQAHAFVFRSGTDHSRRPHPGGSGSEEVKPSVSPFHGPAAQTHVHRQPPTVLRPPSPDCSVSGWGGRAAAAERNGHQQTPGSSRGHTWDSTGGGKWQRSPGSSGRVRDSTEQGSHPLEAARGR